MKTTYTNEQLQAAIDAAFVSSYYSSLVTRTDSSLWHSEETFRLAIARTFLDYLPEAQPPVEKAEANNKLWEEYSKKYRIMDWGYADKQKPEKADPYAELKKAKSEGKQIEVFIEDDEYGPDRWSLKENNSWVRPPECYRIKPEPETFEAHGKTWTRHTPGDPMPCDGERKVYILTSKAGESKGPSKAFMYAWTAKEGEWWREIIGWRYADDPLVTKPDSLPEWAPQVGDVVRLKSGGPLMTVRCFTPEAVVICDWFKSDDERDSVSIPTACLELATKEDAR
jgi:uncharacterized protein YodC (DUF2158 family)